MLAVAALPSAGVQLPPELSAAVSSSESAAGPASVGRGHLTERRKCVRLKDILEDRDDENIHFATIKGFPIQMMQV